MSGAVVRVKRDGLREYIALRREAFGFELTSLPQSLQVSAGDSRLDGVTLPHTRANPSQDTEPHLGKQFEPSANREGHEVKW
ncbi:MAG: hypothetical protein JWO38_1338 [Gemmataceae bacterium]|nr:hypothetical protein [Gemmataceae bacterium]